jgi:hypothetical protein
MKERYYISLNQGKHQDAVISSLFKKYGNGRNFQDFTKDILFEIGLLTFRGDDNGLLSLSPIQVHEKETVKQRKRERKQKGKREEGLSNRTSGAKEDKGNNELTDTAPPDEEGDVSSDDVLNVGNFG